MESKDSENDKKEDEVSHIFISHYETQAQEQEDQQHLDLSEVDELKNRISQLENLVVSATLSAPSFIDKTTSRLTHHGLLQRVSQLESLLAASELDNQRLEREIQLLNASKQEQEYESFRNVKEKDLRIKNLEQDLELANVRLTKSSKKLGSMEAYIVTLPSQQELDDAKGALKNLHLENDSLQNKLERLEVLLHEKQESLLEKDHLYQKVIQKVEELQPIEEAQNSMLSSLSEESEVNLKELVTSQKTQLIRSAKLLKSLQKKVFEGETERAELLLQLEEKEKLISSLGETVKASQLQIENGKHHLKHVEDVKYQMELSILDLKARVDESEKLIAFRRNEMSNLIRLISEVGTAVAEIDQLVLFCRSLSSGQEPNMDLIVGIGQDEGHDLMEDTATTSDKNEFDVDVEWILEKLKLVRDLRTSIEAMWVHIREIYTDFISSDSPSCGVQ